MKNYTKSNKKSDSTPSAQLPKNTQPEITENMYLPTIATQ